MLRYLIPLVSLLLFATYAHGAYRCPPRADGTVVTVPDRYQCETDPAVIEAERRLREADAALKAQAAQAALRRPYIIFVPYPSRPLPPTEP